MKRSDINAVIRRFEALLDKHCFVLPPFLQFTPSEWEHKGSEYNEIREHLLGWDVTDYGLGDFAHTGLALITLRNGGRYGKPAKPYAEKIMMLDKGQVCPMHFHWNKMEDIINRGGGNIEFRLFNATEDNRLANTDVQVNRDGRSYSVPAGSLITLYPGESLTLYPRCYHEFCAARSFGTVLIGEVSMCNDDNSDNCFLDPLGRFPSIEEDEPPYRLLCTEYPHAKN